MWQWDTEVCEVWGSFQISIFHKNSTARTLLKSTSLKTNSLHMLFLSFPFLSGPLVTFVCFYSSKQAILCSYRVFKTDIYANMLCSDWLLHIQPQSRSSPGWNCYTAIGWIGICVCDIMRMWTLSIYIYTLGPLNPQVGAIQSKIQQLLSRQQDLTLLQVYQ